MIRSVSLSAAKVPAVVSAADSSAAEFTRPEPGSFVWYDVSAPDEAVLTQLGERFGFHPLALEDCAHADQRPKAEEYGDHLFLVTQSFQCADGNFDELRWHELHAFLGENYLVTVHDQPIPGLEQVWRRAEGDPAMLARGVDFLYYLLVDRLVDDNIPVLDSMADAIEEIEESVLAHARQEDLTRILGLKRCLVLMRKVLSPQRDVIAMLAKRGDARISEKTSLYFRDIYDHLVRTVESIEANRDLLGNALDVYLSSVSQRTNEIMKALGILSAVFMPLTFITGFFGQNFEGLPFASDTLLWGSLASLIITPSALVFWFKRRQWL
jgi:magnesium transporter